MFNELELQEGVQTESTTGEKKSADEKLKSSASDKVITFLDGTKHVRRLGETVPVLFGGETINLRAGSYHFLGLLKQKITSVAQRMTVIAMAANAILKEIEAEKDRAMAGGPTPVKTKKTRKPEEAQLEIAGAETSSFMKNMTENVAEIYRNMDDVRGLTQEAKIAAVQFIIYDAKHPDWHVTAGEGMPPAEVLEKVYSKEKIIRFARREEVDNLLYVYKQMHEAVLPSESFFGLQGVI